MLQPQLINQIPDPQSITIRPARKAAPSALPGLFGKMLENNGAALPGGISSMKKQPAADMPLKTEEQPLAEQNPLLFLVPPPIVAPPAPESPVDMIQPADLSARALHIMESIVSILEGKQDNIPVNKEIAPLLAELEHIAEKLPPEPPSADLAKEIPLKPHELPPEVTARMPLPEIITESNPTPDKLQRFIETLRGYLSPLENVNDAENNREAVDETKIITLKAPPAAQAQEQPSRQQQDINDKAGGDKAPDIPAAAVSFDVAPHKAAFAESLNALAEPRSIPFTPENLFEVMVERIVSLPGAEPHMEISLKPDHLGKVHVELLLGPEGLTAKIIAGDEGVKNLLAAHINSLSETLAEKGIRVVNVEITYAALADKPFDQRQPDQRQAEQNEQARAVSQINLPDNVIEWWDMAYDMPLYTDGGPGLSSVEYRA